KRRDGSSIFQKPNCILPNEAAESKQKHETNLLEMMEDLGGWEGEV
ncbi:hypothetical protein CEXT_728341, partial [Caerostris extrusa]